MPVERRVLVVAGTVTSTMRLLAVLPLIESDRRVHVVFTHDECSPSTLMAGVPEFLETARVKVIPWGDATLLTWDLVLTASEKDRVHRLDGPVVLLPHGAGFQKRDVAHGGVAGLGSEFLLGEDGQPKPAVIALSHPEQRDLLASSCPEAADRAVVVGDPCVDVMVANRHRRARYRDALGVGDRRLIVVSSTWGGESLFGRTPDLLENLLARLPVDAYRCCLLTHPGILAVHGQRQLRAWLGTAVDMGLTVIPTTHRWEPILLSADCVIADQGSMSVYAAALDLPLIMAGGSPEATVSESPVSELARRVPRLAHIDRVREQVESAIDGHEPGRYSDVMARAFDKPDATAERLRHLLYQVLDLAEPASPATFGLLPPPVVPRPTPTAFSVRGALVDQRIALDRTAAPQVRSAQPGEVGYHLVAHGIDASRGVLVDAQVIYTDATLCLGRAEFESWAESVWTHWPRAEVAAVVVDDRTCRIATPGGSMVEFSIDTGIDAGRPNCDPLLLASLAWILLKNKRRLDGQHLITVPGTGDPVAVRGEILRQR